MILYNVGPGTSSATFPMPGTNTSMPSVGGVVWVECPSPAPEEEEWPEEDGPHGWRPMPDDREGIAPRRALPQQRGPIAWKLPKRQPNGLGRK